MLSGCRIEPNAIAHPDAGVEPYVMEFHFAGHRYVCPLFCFQPRTQPAAPVPLEGADALKAIAV